MEDRVLQAIIALAVPVTGFLTWFFQRGHKNKIEDRDSTAEAMMAISKSAHELVDVWGDLLEPFKRRLDSQSKRIDKLEGLVDSLVVYVKSLRRQIIDLGHEPEPFPEELSHLDEGE